MQSGNQSIYILLKKYEGQEVLILTKSNLHYKASNLRVLPEAISFTDKHGAEVILAISEVLQVTEVSNGD